MPEWQLIVLEGSRAEELAARKEGGRLELYWVEFDSSDEEEGGERDQLFDFMVRPLDSLTGSGPLAVDGLAIDGVDENWRVVTTIRNHHRGLNPRITRFTATVSGDEEAVYLDAYKQTE